MLSDIFGYIRILPKQLGRKFFAEYAPVLPSANKSTFNPNFVEGVVHTVQGLGSHETIFATLKTYCLRMHNVAIDCHQIWQSIISSVHRIVKFFIHLPKKFC